MHVKSGVLMNGRIVTDVLFNMVVQLLNQREKDTIL